MVMGVIKSCSSLDGGMWLLGVVKSNPYSLLHSTVQCSTLFV